MTNLWAHQREAVEFLRDKSAGALFMEMGTGKTLAALELLRLWDCKNVLVLCPKSVVSVWPAEAEKHCPGTFRTYAPRKGTVKQKAEGLSKTAAIAEQTGEGLLAVFNYEAAVREPLYALCLIGPWNAVVLDESHRIKAPDGSTSQAVAEIVRNRHFRLALTGTPMPHSPLDIWAQYRALDPSVFGTSWTLFKSRYAVEKPGVVKTRDAESWPRGEKPAQVAALEAALGEPLREWLVRAVWSGKTVNECASDLGVHRRLLWRWLPALGLRVFNRVDGVRNLEDLHERVYRIAYRCRAEDVLDLPEAVDVTRTCELGPPAARAYRQMAEELRVQVEEGVVTAGNALVKLLRLQQIGNGYLPVEGAEAVLDRAKADLLEDVLADLQPPGAEDEAEPVVVFCRFHHDLDVVRERASKLGHSVGELSGRANDLAAWQAGERNVLAVQEQAGGLGVDMSRARYAVFYSLNWSLGDYQQARARVHRPGQTRNVTYVHLVAEGTVDETIMEALVRKEDVVRRVVDGLRKPSKG